MSIRATASVEEQERYGHCFACGAANDSGLNLEFDALEDGSVTALYAPQERYQGWPNVLHGGIVATLLDEAAAYVAYARGQHAATARLNIRYSHAAPLDAPLRVTATLVKDTRRMLTIEARVTTLEDEKIATAEATLLLLTAQTGAGIRPASANRRDEQQQLEQQVGRDRDRWPRSCRRANL